MKTVRPKNMRSFSSLFHAATALALTNWVLPAATEEAITHSFLATGAETRIVGGDGKAVWRFPKSTRDGWVLPNGNLLLAVAKDKDYPGGAVVEVKRDGQIVFEWKGTQSEVNTAQGLAGDRILL